MVRGLLISAPRSGEGKTLITLALLHLLKRKGYKVQPFKIGPDFIDPKWHKLACGVPSYNLDFFSMGEVRLKALFSAKAKNADLALVEGVMGLFDGTFSTFRVAKLLRLPILLVVDTFGTAESIKYLIKGIAERIKKAGLSFFLLLNRVSSERHLLRLEKALKSYPILGFLPRSLDFELPSRHLGLYLPEDLSRASEVIERASFELEKRVDLTWLNKAQFELSSLPLPSFLPRIPYKAIALAYDEAFNFYYPHLLEELAEGVRLYFFSPLRDEAIPGEAEAVYIGGGYPELWAEKLSKNKKTQRFLREWVLSGLPLYAECGGLVYLSKTLNWENQSFNLAQIFPFEITKKGLTLGLRVVKPINELPLFETKLPFFAHEFHYTGIEGFLGEKEVGELKTIFKVNSAPREPKAYKSRRGYFWEGFLYRRALATYFHLLAFQMR